MPGQIKPNIGILHVGILVLDHVNSSHHLQALSPAIKALSAEHLQRIHLGRGGGGGTSPN